VLRLAVLIPVHNEVLSVPSIFRRVKDSLESQSVDWQAVFLNNASEDATLQAILEIRQSDARVKVITLSRNFGYQASLLAGLSTLESDLYAIVDGDGEDPPELFPQFLERLRAGEDVAYGIRSRRLEPWPITLCRRLFYALLRGVADNEIIMWMGEFSMMTRTVRDAIIRGETSSPFLRAELGYVGFRRSGIAYVRGKRTAGRTHYNILQMTKFAATAFLTSSTFPLRLIFYAAGFLAAAWPVGALVFHWRAIDGMIYATIALFYFSLLCGSMLGLYLARTYKNTARRPIFVIDPKGTRLS